MRRTWEAKESGRGLTVGEIREFLAALDGIPEGTVPTAGIRFGGAIRRLSVEVDEPDLGSLAQAIERAADQEPT